MFSPFRYSIQLPGRQSRRAFMGFVLLIVVGVLSLSNYNTGLVFALIVIWAFWGLRDPVGSFSTLFLYFNLFYARSTVGDMTVGIYGNRGAFRVGDLMWTITFFTVLINVFLISRQRRYIPFFSKIGGILPYVILASTLPLVGVLVGQWPASYAIPGLRHLQWASFAWMAYYLAFHDSSETLIKRISRLIAWTCIIHAIYAFLQLGYSSGFIPSSIMYLDNLIKESSTSHWFYYPRTTGLLLNPNSYGMFSAICVMVGLLWNAQEPKAWLWRIMTFGGVFGMITSGSRSGLAGGLLSLIILYIRPGAMTKRRIKSLIQLSGMLLFIGLVVYFSSVHVPENLRERFGRMVLVSQQGVGADDNLASRVGTWTSLYAESRVEYPFGTWVPPSYAFEKAVDSYYMQTWLQGTLIFMLAFILLMLFAILRGINLARSLIPGNQLAGFLLISCSGVILATSFSSSPLLEPHINAVFWSLLGFVIALKVQTRIRYAHM